jgi:hypothetical protein
LLQLGITVTASKSSSMLFNKRLRLAGYGYFAFDGPFATPRREGSQSLLVLELPFFLPSSCTPRDTGHGRRGGHRQRFPQDSAHMREASISRLRMISDYTIG